MAIKRWIGGAAARVDLWTITVAGTWASGDTVTVSIGNKDLVITLGGAASTLVADIAEQISDAFNAADNSTPGTGFTWSHGGQEFAEFQDLTATVLGAVVTLTGATAGLPHTVVVTEVTAGDGTATEANPAGTKATGPNFLDNADNYLGGVLPLDNDDLYFDTGAVSALYGLTYFRANNIDLNYYITGDWTGALGLPALRTSPHSYAEYRQRYFQVRGGSKTLEVNEGLAGATNQGALYLDFQDQTSMTVRIRASRGSASAVPAIYIAGPIATGLFVETGTVSIEPDDAGTDPAKYFTTQDLQVGRVGVASTAIVYVGSNAILSTATRLQVHSGSLITYAGTDDGVDDCKLELFGGSAELKSADNFGALDIYTGATVYPTGQGAIDTVQLFGGTLDFRRGQSIMLTPTIKMYAGSSLYDPVGGSVSDIDFVGCRMSQVTLDLRANQHIALTTATP